MGCTGATEPGRRPPRAAARDHKTNYRRSGTREAPAERDCLQPDILQDSVKLISMRLL